MIFVSNTGHPASITCRIRVCQVNPNYETAQSAPASQQTCTTFIGHIRSVTVTLRVNYALPE